MLFDVGQKANGIEMTIFLTLSILYFVLTIFFLLIYLINFILFLCFTVDIISYDEDGSMVHLNLQPICS